MFWRQHQASCSPYPGSDRNPDYRGDGYIWAPNDTPRTLKVRDCLAGPCCSQSSPGGCCRYEQPYVSALGCTTKFLLRKYGGCIGMFSPARYGGAHPPSIMHLPVSLGFLVPENVFRIYMYMSFLRGCRRQQHLSLYSASRQS